MIAILIYFGIIIISAFAICLIKIKIDRKANKKKQKIIKYYFEQELIDADIPYNGPDFVNRFETDAWDLRN